MGKAHLKKLLPLVTALAISQSNNERPLCKAKPRCQHIRPASGKWLSTACLGGPFCWRERIRHCSQGSWGSCFCTLIAGMAARQRRKTCGVGYDGTYSWQRLFNGQAHKCVLSLYCKTGPLLRHCSTADSYSLHLSQ